MLTAGGIGSGLDIKGLVQQLVSAERAGSDLQLTRQTNKANTQLSALGSFKSALGGFQSTLSNFNIESAIGKTIATSSDSSMLSAVATATAVPNSYSLAVNQLANSHSLASMSFAATDTTIGSGTLTFRFGTTNYNANTDAYSGFTLNPDSNVSTITIDSSNNTLAGVMKAINDANVGVNASIVNAGDGYKLLMTSKNTGLANSMEVTTVDGDGNNTDVGANAGLSNFAFSAAATNMSQTIAANDASFSINGLPITSASNTVKNAIVGVDVTLKNTTTSPVTLSVKKDNSTAVAAVNSLVSGYNAFINTVNSLTGYDKTKNLGGPLMGDFSVRAITNQMNGVLRNAVGGLAGNYKSLTEIGLKTASDGTYTLDTAKFNEALSAIPADLPAIFSAFGKATDTNVKYVNSTSTTAVGNYNVNITALATNGNFTGTGVLPTFTPGDYLTIDSNNNSFNVEVDGVETGTINLTVGEYNTGTALAQEIQARINGASSLVSAGISAKVTYDASNSLFKIESTSLGSTSTVNFKAVGANVTSTLGFAVTDGTAGLDVAGSIGGVAATGLGNVLKGAVDSDAENLELQISGSTTGARGSINFTRGIVNQLSTYLKSILDSEGSLQSRVQNLKDRVTAVDDKRARQEIRWTAVQARYTRQFNAMDALVASLNTTSTFLTQQLDKLPGV